MNVLNVKFSLSPSNFSIPCNLPTCMTWSLSKLHVILDPHLSLLLLAHQLAPPFPLRITSPLESTSSLTSSATSWYVDSVDWASDRWSVRLCCRVWPVQQWGGVPRRRLHGLRPTSLPLRPRRRRRLRPRLAPVNPTPTHRFRFRSSRDRKHDEQRESSSVRRERLWVGRRADGRRRWWQVHLRHAADATTRHCHRRQRFTQSRRGRSLIKSCTFRHKLKTFLFRRSSDNVDTWLLDNLLLFYRLFFGFYFLFLYVLTPLYFW